MNQIGTVKKQNKKETLKKHVKLNSKNKPIIRRRRRRRRKEKQQITEVVVVVIVIVYSKRYAA